jgi:hypothetical protein
VRRTSAAALPSPAGAALGEPGVERRSRAEPRNPWLPAPLSQKPYRGGPNQDPVLGSPLQGWEAIGGRDQGLHEQRAGARLAPPLAILGPPLRATL